MFIVHYVSKLGYNTFDNDCLNDCLITVIKYTILHMEPCQIRKSLSTYNFDMAVIKEYRDFLAD